MTCTDFVTVKKTEHTIGNLDDDTKYRFEVSAFNVREDGQGPPASVEITTQSKSSVFYYIFACAATVFCEFEGVACLIFVDKCM